MSQAPVRPDESLESLVAQVVDEFRERQRRGEQPEVEEYARRYPQAAELLRKVLASWQLIGLSAARPPVAAGDGSEEQVAGLLGDFRLVREVGRGGMGVVYEAEQVSLGRRVALKVLPFAATMDPRQLQRFHNEARAAAGLHHTNIVPVHAVGCERGVHYYAMQFIDGRPLSALIQQLRQAEEPGEAERTTAYRPAGEGGAANATVRADGEATPRTGPGKRGWDYWRQVAQLGVQAAEALDHAHQMGIVHRDVKPANLLLDGRGNLWVTDFGLAQVQSDHRLTLSGDLVGTLRYMSPEQALARRVVLDHRTDVYSLGATLYELLTLQPVFSGSDRQELLRQIAFDEPLPPRRLNKAIPAELEVIVLKALEKDPAERYATAAELADDLGSWLEDRPLRARAPSLLQRARKWARRRRGLVAAAAACLLVALAVLAGSVGWVASAQTERRRATEVVVGQALDESADWQRQRRLPEALSAAQRAAGLLAGGEAGDALRRRVQDRVADLQWLKQLENVRLELTADRDRHHDFAGADAGYTEFFRAGGVDVARLAPEEAGEGIRRSTVAVEVAAVLDHWSYVRWQVRGPDDPTRKGLLRVARAADPDGWRGRVRQALGRRDAKGLVELVRPDEVGRLLPSTLSAVAALLRGGAVGDRAEALLREGQRQHPNDFWTNQELALFLHRSQPPRLEEAIRFFTAAVVLRPQSPGAHTNLGAALRDKGQLDEAITEHRAAIRLNKDHAVAHTNLGLALQTKGQWDEAIAEYRAAIRLNKDDALAHNNLGAALYAKGQWDEAIAACRTAIRLKKDYAEAHNNLGAALYAKGQLDEAIACYRAAIRLKKDHAEAHNNLGAALGDKGQLDEAIACYQKAIRLKKDYAEAHCALGLALWQQGRFADALAALQRGHELGSRKPRWPYPSSAQWVRRCQRLLHLDRKLPAILSGRQQPADVAERLALAELCQLPCRKRYRAALRFYEGAFAAEPRLAGEQPSAARYNAACAAALAGCGRGEDEKDLGQKERARLRRQALDWLRADLQAWQRLLGKEPGKAAPLVVRQLRHWLADSAFAGLRGPAALAGLGEAERPAWQKLWADVADTLHTAAAKAAAAKRPDRR
jgi:serine/threonine protein kinase/Flp pilus assembly protein TadD